VVCASVSISRSKRVTRCWISSRLCRYSCDTLREPLAAQDDPRREGRAFPVGRRPSFHAIWRLIITKSHGRNFVRRFRERSCLRWHLREHAPDRETTHVAHRESRLASTRRCAVNVPAYWRLDDRYAICSARAECNELLSNVVIDLLDEPAPPRRGSDRQEALPPHLLSSHTTARAVRHTAVQMDTHKALMLLGEAHESQAR
jgi:hypothetical protein